VAKKTGDKISGRNGLDGPLRLRIMKVPDQRGADHTEIAALINLREPV
jgi:hypothetical protein